MRDLKMKKINAYVGDCVSENIGVIIDDYPNKEGNSEFAVNLHLDNSLLNLYKEKKKMDLSNMLLLISTRIAKS